MSDIMAILTDWTNNAEKAIIANYDKMGFRASGQFEKDIESKISQNGTKYNIQILGSYYTFWLENGRKPGKFPPKNVILKWIDEKGIVANGISKNSLAYLIGRKIAQEGTIKRHGIVSNVVNDQLIGQLFESIRKEALGELQTDYKLMFK